VSCKELTLSYKVYRFKNERALFKKIVSIESEKREIEERLKHDKEFFLRREAYFVKNYPNEYIVIMAGKVIGHHKNIEELIKKLHKKYGSAPFFISKARTDPSYVIIPSRKFLS